MLNMFLLQSAIAEDLLKCVQAWSDTRLLFCSQFLVGDADAILDYFQHRFVWVAIRFIVVYSLPCLVFLFFEKGMTSDSIYSFGSFFAFPGSLAQNNHELCCFFSTLPEQLKQTGASILAGVKLTNKNVGGGGGIEKY